MWKIIVHDIFVMKKAIRSAIEDLEPLSAEVVGVFEFAKEKGNRLA